MFLIDRFVDDLKMWQTGSVLEINDLNPQEAFEIVRDLTIKRTMNAVQQYLVKDTKIRRKKCRKY